MSDDCEPKSNHRNAVWPVAFVMLPILYVLSIGPYVWWQSHGSKYPTAGELSTFYTIYGPLLWLADQSDWIGSTLNWYVGLFGA